MHKRGRCPHLHWHFLISQLLLWDSLKAYEKRIWCSSKTECLKNGFLMDAGEMSRRLQTAFAQPLLASFWSQSQVFIRELMNFDKEQRRYQRPSVTCDPFKGFTASERETINPEENVNKDYK